MFCVMTHGRSQATVRSLVDEPALYAAWFSFTQPTHSFASISSGMADMSRSKTPILPEVVNKHGTRPGEPMNGNMGYK
jgi:hypothetical protein